MIIKNIHDFHFKGVYFRKKIIFHSIEGNILQVSNLFCKMKNKTVKLVIHEFIKNDCFLRLKYRKKFSLSSVTNKAFALIKCEIAFDPMRPQNDQNPSLSLPVISYFKIYFT